MSLGGVGTSELASRSQGVLASGGVVAALAARQRVDLPDSPQVARRQGSAARDKFSLDKDKAPSSQNRPNPQESGDGQASARPSTAFLAQSLGQDGGADSSSAPAASLIQIGVSAYAKAGRAGSGPSDPGIDVILPPGGALASGHSLDLAV